MLFIYYLKSQLGYSMPQIVQNGGATLADTYRNFRAESLTGFGSSNYCWQGISPSVSSPLPTTRFL